MYVSLFAEKTWCQALNLPVSDPHAIFSITSVGELYVCWLVTSSAIEHKVKSCSSANRLADHIVYLSLITSRIRRTVCCFRQSRSLSVGKVAGRRKRPVGGDFDGSWHHQRVHYSWLWISFETYWLWLHHLHHGQREVHWCIIGMHFLLVPSLFQTAVLCCLILSSHVLHCREFESEPD